MDIILQSIPLLEYYGENTNITDFYFGFRKRLVANDFSGKLEIFYSEALFYEKIRLRDKYLNDIKFHFSHKSAREKLTQLIVSAYDCTNLIKELERNIAKLSSKKIVFPEGHHTLINQVELYVLKLISFLDVMAKLNSRVYRINGITRVREKYGQQKEIDSNSGQFKHAFDLPFQNRLLKNRKINILHKYRNEFSHEKSVIVIPYFRKNSCKLIFSIGSRKGIKLNEAIVLSMKEVKRFASFSENYFIKKFH